jgi:Type IV secretion-system coupling protein DNA-binding domain
MDNQDKVTYFAETDFRNTKTKFGIKAKDRTRHMYIIGKTGMGKSTMLENLAIQDIQNDEGIIFIDPHGSAAVKLLDYVPKHRIDDVIYFAPADTDYPISFNVLEQVPKDKRNAVASGLMNAFKKIWVDAWSSRMEYLLNYSLLALLDVPGSTLLGINRLLSDKHYRKHIIDQVEDPIVKNFWNNEFTKYNDKYASEAVAPIQNKIGQFISNPLVRNIIGQEKSTIDFRKIMDEKKILIINLSKGMMGPENMRLLGGMLVTKIYLAAMSRADMSDAQMARMPACYMYVDEFQNFANESFAEILSESRKYKLALTVANQYIEQMTDEVKAAIFGNIGSFVSFRVGPIDAELMEKEFAPAFLMEDFVNLGFTQNYLRLMIDGIGSKPFSSSSLPPLPRPEGNYVSDIVSYSREHYTLGKSIVEANITKWSDTEHDPKAHFKTDNRDDRPRENRENRDNREARDDRENRDRRDNRPERENKYDKKTIVKNTITPRVNHVKPEVKIDKVDEVKTKVENSFKLGDLINKAMADKLNPKNEEDDKIEQEKIEKQKIDSKIALRKILSANTVDFKKSDHVRGKAKAQARNVHFIETNSDHAKSNINHKSEIDEVPEDILRALLDDN